MLYYIKKYPFSLLIIGVVIYLSLFKPPSFDLPHFQGWDKFVHFCMYGGVSGMLWLEFLFNYRYRKDELKLWKAILGAVIFPILLGGAMEIGQALLTTYRSGDWLDMLANTAGVLTASLIAWYMLRPIIIRKN